MNVLEFFYGEKPEIGREMTLEDLALEVRLTGRPLVGCMGKIYDVTENRSFSEGCDKYHLIGKDASVPLAKMKFDPKYEFEDLHWSRDLNDAEYTILKEWSKKFEDKNDFVGFIKEEKKKQKDKKLKK